MFQRSIEILDGAPVKPNGQRTPPHAITIESRLNWVFKKTIVPLSQLFCCSRTRPAPKPEDADQQYRPCV